MQAPVSQSPTRPAYTTVDSTPPFPVPIIPSLGYRPDQQPLLNGDHGQYSHQLSHEPEHTRSANAEGHYMTNEKYYAEQEEPKDARAKQDLLPSRVQFAAYGANDEKGMAQPMRRSSGAYSALCS